MGQLKIDPTQILVYLQEFVAYAPTSQIVRYSQLAAFTLMFYDWSELCCISTAKTIHTDESHSPQPRPRNQLRLGEQALIRAPRSQPLTSFSLPSDGNGH